MEKCESVDQRPVRVGRFLAQYRRELMQQGAVVAMWRNRAGRRLGPYYRLTCRDMGGRPRSVYLGAAGPVVEAARLAVAGLQAPVVERRQLACIRKQLRTALKRARVELDVHLQPLGLARKGSEIRGWSRAKKLLLDVATCEQ